MSYPLFNEFDLPAGGAVDDIDSILAALALEPVTAANEAYTIPEPEEDEEAEDEFLESAFEDLSDPFGALD